MIEFRVLEDGDISLVEQWLNKDHVKRWYDIPEQEVSIDDWLYELKERHGEFHWLNHLIVMNQDTPIGMCQYYKCKDSVDEDFGSLVIENSYGIDYLIGEKDYLGKGIGKEMIEQLVKRILELPDAQRVTADIDNENLASKNVLLSCGFKMLDEDGSRYVFEK